MEPDALHLLRAELRALADPQRATHSLRFFKTGPGQYGAGDRFLGLTVPQVRAAVRRHRDLPLESAAELLRSELHEERLCALLLLVERYRRGDVPARREVYDLYLSHTAHINNWDLVDSSAEHIVGAELTDRPDRREVLERLADSPSLFERRIAMISTFYWIKRGQSDDALHLAERLLRDREDLIHKAVGWMLREIGQRCGRPVLLAFLERHRAEMPRTALRYAIEHLPKDERAALMERPARASRSITAARAARSGAGEQR